MRKALAVAAAWPSGVTRWRKGKQIDCWLRQSKAALRTRASADSYITPASR